MSSNSLFEAIDSLMLEEAWLITEGPKHHPEIEEITKPLKEVYKILQRRTSLVDFDRDLLRRKVKRILVLLGIEEWEIE